MLIVVDAVLVPVWVLIAFAALAMFGFVYALAIGSDVAYHKRNANLLAAYATYLEDKCNASATEMLLESSEYPCDPWPSSS